MNGMEMKKWQADAELVAQNGPPKPLVPEELGPIPDLLVLRCDGTPSIHPGTPEGVGKRLREMVIDRDRIIQMWRSEGKTKTFIPNTGEARTMKMRAKLQNRVETKHAEVTKRLIQTTTKRITDDPNIEWATIPAMEIV
jgi:hypothetical protein